jgi:hypothetical protein
MRSICLMAWVAACGGAVHGTRVADPAPAGAPIETATTSQPGGLRVLAYGPAGGGGAGLIATSRDQLADLWTEVGESGPPPAVDFATHLVIATNFEGGDCEAEIVAAHVDARGELTLDEASTADWCDLVAYRVAEVIAVPRAIIGPRARFTWRVSPKEAFAFDVPPAPEGGFAPPSAPPLERASIEHPRGVIELPARGHIALRALDDGREVWVAQRAGGAVSVVLADAASLRDGVRNPIRWDAARNRLGGAYDPAGRAIAGGRSLEAFAFARTDATHAAIGELAPVPDGPIDPRSDALALDGSAVPYEALDATSFAQLADRHIGKLDADLITGLDRTTHLCKLPEGKLRQYLPGCPTGAPALPGRHGNGVGIDELDGPVVARRRGDGIDLVIATGNGMAGWTVERALPAPAPRGPTRAAGALAIGTSVHGDTADAKDGFTPACIPAEASGGPDESWSFTAPADARYAFQLDSDRDSVIAVVAESGTVLACDDDRHGFYASSIVHLDLARGAKVRVIADAFGGFRQRYTLRATVEPPLANGGVLPIGATVSGDTTNAIDDHSEGCYAPAGDHAYQLAIDRAGTYVFRVETTGWPVLLSVVGSFCHDSTTPLVEKVNLEPGTYTVVVDGDNVKNAGRYTLRVDRAP